MYALLSAEKHECSQINYPNLGRRPFKINCQFYRMYRGHVYATNFFLVIQRMVNIPFIYLLKYTTQDLHTNDVINNHVTIVFFNVGPSVEGDW